VPIVEPEILMDGDHDIETTARIQEKVRSPFPPPRPAPPRLPARTALLVRTRGRARGHAWGRVLLPASASSNVRA
jgi:hypothetical protein